MDSTKDLKSSPSGGSAEGTVMDTLRNGYHTRDAAMIASVYAEDVELTICNRNNPPAKRLVLRGREAVRRMLDDLCAREMTHQIGHVTLGEGTIAFSFQCQYPDGCQVVALNVATLKKGLIVSELSVDCWDE